MAEPVLFKNGFTAWSTSTGSPAADQLLGVKSVQLPFDKAQLANSVMGDGAETFHPGLISVPISVTQRQDFTTGGAALGDFGADKEAWTRWNGETKFRLKVRAVNSAVSSTNPSYVFSSVRLFSYTPITGSHGQLLENKLEFRMTSGCTITRSTST